MRTAVLNLQESRIREVANAGIGREDVLPFWFGDSDEVTPEFIRQAAIESLQRGETFYGTNLGLPELREAIARHMATVHQPITCDRLAVTSGGVNALMLALQALVFRLARPAAPGEGCAAPACLDAGLIAPAQAPRVARTPLRLYSPGFAYRKRTSGAVPAPVASCQPGAHASTAIEAPVGWCPLSRKSQ